MGPLKGQRSSGGNPSRNNPFQKSSEAVMLVLVPLNCVTLAVALLGYVAFRGSEAVTSRTGIVPLIASDRLRSGALVGPSTCSIRSLRRSTSASGSVTVLGGGAATFAVIVP